MPKDATDYLSANLREVPAFRALLRGIEARLFAELGPWEPPVLDVGCGDGHFVSVAFDASLFIGFDLQQAIVKEAASRHVYQHVMVASATAMPFADASFSTVISNCVIEHIPDLDSALAEIHRVLRPGGRLAFTVPSHYFAEFLLGSTLLRRLGALHLAVGYGRWFNRHSRHYHTYAPEVWERRLMLHGFEIVHWRYYMSAAGHRAFDLAHYLSVPALITRKLTGRWVLWYDPVTSALLQRWLRPYYAETFPEKGAYIFFDCRQHSRPMGHSMAIG